MLLSKKCYVTINGLANEGGRTGRVNYFRIVPVRLISAGCRFLLLYVRERILLSSIL